MLKDEGTLDLAVQCMASLYNEGRPGMLMEEDLVSAQRSLVSIILECSEASGYIPHIHCMHEVAQIGACFDWPLPSIDQ